jgi:tRNA nucleotidyltransferase (CCA-adding enzyme)
MVVPNLLIDISRKFHIHSAKAIIVGGSVRDYFLKLPIKDYDIEVYGLGRLDELEAILKEFGSVSFVGKSFGVLKLSTKDGEYDFSFPRSEKRVGSGHRGFEVYPDGYMSFKEASLRRDFTVNAMGYDIEAKEFLDPYNGIGDIKRGILRSISSKTFIEDPLRVYRAIQFCARFEYKLEEHTSSLCRSMVDKGVLEQLPKERVYEEFKKLLTRSKKPSIGFNIMRDLGVLRYFPELNNLIGVEQESRWHPEGDVWIHTLMSLDAVTDKSDLKIMLSLLCHDLGKPYTTRVENGKITSKGHSEAGVDITKKFLYRLCDEHSFIDSIATLVLYHKIPTEYFKNKANDSMIRHLSTKVNIRELIKVARADFLGRTTIEAKSGIYEAGDWLFDRARDLNVLDKPPKALLRGRDLIELGLTPSKEFSKILDSLYERQLDGDIVTKEDALVFVKNILKV